MRTLSVVGLMAVSMLCAMPAAAGRTAAQKCTALKLKAAGKNAACQTRAMAKAVAAGGTADLTACEAKFAGMFAKLELKGDCATTGDATAIGSRINATTTGILTQVSGSCAPITCADNGGACGIIPDGCGGTVDCGACDHPCSSDADCINTYHCWADHCVAKDPDFAGCLGQNSCLSLCCCVFEVCQEHIDGAVHPSPGMCLEPELCPAQSWCPGGTASDLPDNNCGGIL